MGRVKVKKVPSKDKKNFIMISCRFCPCAPGKYFVEENGEKYSLCEKHYQEALQKGILPEVDV